MDTDIEENQRRINAILADQRLSEEQRTVMERFDNYNQIKDLSSFTRVGYLYYLREMAVLIGKPFAEFNRQDIEKYLLYKKKGNVHSLNGEHLGRQVMVHSEVTTFKGRVFVRLFFKWLNDGVLSDCVKWVERRNPHITKSARDMLTREEVKKLADACTDWRHSVMIRIQYEALLRSGELRAIKLGDIKLEESYAEIRIRSRQ